MREMSNQKIGRIQPSAINHVQSFFLYLILIDIEKLDEQGF